MCISLPNLVDTFPLHHLVNVKPNFTNLLCSPNDNPLRSLLFANSHLQYLREAGANAAVV